MNKLAIGTMVKIGRMKGRPLNATAKVVGIEGGMFSVVTENGNNYGLYVNRQDINQYEVVI